MANPVPVTYNAAASPVAGGRPAYAVPDLAGGTAHLLLADWTGVGYVLLSTVPGPPTYTQHPHAGSCWDERREILWIVGAETHGSVSGMDNAVYRWDAADGLVRRMYAPDPFPGDYLQVDGMLFADPLRMRPWATHSYRQIRYIPETDEIEVAVDTGDHAYWTPPILGPGTFGDRAKPIWYYNTRRGTWRWAGSPATTSFIGGMSGVSVVFAPGDGWYRFQDPWAKRLSADQQSGSSTSLTGKITTRYHCYSHLIGRTVVKFGGGVSSSPDLCSVHPLDNLTASYVVPLATFPALTGWDITNNWSALMPDGRIVFGAQNADGTQGAFIYDWISNTVTDTGHRLSESLGVTTYSLKAEWSLRHECVVMLSHRNGSPNKIYALRIE